MTEHLQVSERSLVLQLLLCKKFVGDCCGEATYWIGKGNRDDRWRAAGRRVYDCQCVRACVCRHVERFTVSRVVVPPATILLLERAVYVMNVV